MGGVAGVPEWPKGSGLGPDGLVLRGFEPHPPHQSFFPSTEGNFGKKIVGGIGIWFSYFVGRFGK